MDASNRIGPKTVPSAILLSASSAARQPEAADQTATKIPPKEPLHADELVEDDLCQRLCEAGFLDEHFTSLNEKKIQKPLRELKPHNLDKIFAVIREQLPFLFPATANFPAYKLTVDYNLLMYAFIIVRELSFTPIKSLYQHGSSVAATLGGAWCAEDIISIVPDLKPLVERIDSSYLDKKKKEVDTCVDGTGGKPLNGHSHPNSEIDGLIDSEKYHLAVIDLLIYRHHHVLSFVLKYDDRMQSAPICGFKQLILYLKNINNRFCQGKALSCITVADVTIPWLKEVSISGLLLQSLFVAVDQITLSPQIFEYEWNPELQKMACTYLFHNTYASFFKEIGGHFKFFDKSETEIIQDKCVKVKDWTRLVCRGELIHDVICLRVHTKNKQFVSFQNLQIQLLNAFKKIGSIYLTGSHTAALHLLCRLFHWVNLAESNETDWALFCWLVAHKYRCVDGDTQQVLTKRLIAYAKAYRPGSGPVAGVISALRSYLNKATQFTPEASKPLPEEILFFLLTATGMLPNKEVSPVDLTNIWKAFDKDCAGLSIPLDRIGTLVFQQQADIRLVHAYLHLMAFRYLLSSASSRKAAAFTVVYTKHLRQPVLQLRFGPYALTFCVDLAESCHYIAEAMGEPHNKQEAIDLMIEALGLPPSYTFTTDSVIHKKLKNHSLSLDVSNLSKEGIALIRTGQLSCVKLGYELLLFCYALNPTQKRFTTTLHYIPFLLRHETDAQAKDMLCDFIGKHFDTYFSSLQMNVRRQLIEIVQDPRQREAKAVLTRFIEGLIASGSEPLQVLAADMFLDGAGSFDEEEHARKGLLYIQQFAEKHFKTAVKFAEQLQDLHPQTLEEWLPVFKILGQGALKESNAAQMITHLCHVLELMRKYQNQEQEEDSSLHQCVYEWMAQMFARKHQEAAMRLMVTAYQFKILQQALEAQIAQSWLALSNHVPESNAAALKTLDALAVAYHSEEENISRPLCLGMFLELAKVIIQRKNKAKCIFDECKKFLTRCDNSADASALIQQFNGNNLLIHQPVSSLWIDYCQHMLSEQGSSEAMDAWNTGEAMKFFAKLNYTAHRKFILTFLEKLYQTDDKDALALADKLYAELNANKTIEIDPKLEAIVQKKKIQEEVETLFTRCKLGNAQQSINRLLILLDMDKLVDPARLRELMGKWLPNLCGENTPKGSLSLVCDTLERPKVCRLYQEHEADFLRLFRQCLGTALTLNAPPRDDGQFRRLIKIVLSNVFRQRQSEPNDGRVSIVKTLISILNHDKRPKGLAQLRLDFKRCHEGLFQCIFASQQPHQMFALTVALDRNAIFFTPALEVVDRVLDAMVENPENRVEMVAVILRNWAYAQMAWSTPQMKAIQRLIELLVKERQYPEAALLLEKVLLPKHRKHPEVSSALGPPLYNWASVFPSHKGHYSTAVVCLKELYKNFRQAFPCGHSLLELLHHFPEPVLLLEPMLSAEIIIQEFENWKKEESSQNHFKKLHQQVKILVQALINNKSNHKAGLERALELLDKTSYPHDILWHAVLKTIYKSGSTEMKQKAWNKVKDRKSDQNLLRDANRYAEWAQLETCIVRILIDLLSLKDEDVYLQLLVSRCQALFKDQDSAHIGIHEKLLCKSLKAILIYSRGLLRKPQCVLPPSIIELVKNLRSKLESYLAHESRQEQRRDIDLVYVRVVTASLANVGAAQASNADSKENIAKPSYEDLNAYNILWRLMHKDFKPQMIDQELYDIWIRLISASVLVKGDASKTFIPLLKTGVEFFNQHLKKRFDPIFLAEAMSHYAEDEILLMANDLLNYRLSHPSAYEALPRTLQTHPSLCAVFERITKRLIEVEPDVHLFFACLNLRLTGATAFGEETISLLHRLIIEKMGQALIFSKNGIPKVLGDMIAFLRQFEKENFMLIQERLLKKPVSRLQPLIAELAEKIDQDTLSVANLMRIFFCTYLEYIDHRYELKMDRAHAVDICRKEWAGFLERIKNECNSLTINTGLTKSGDPFHRDHLMMCKFLLNQGNMDKNIRLFIVCYGWYQLQALTNTYKTSFVMSHAEFAQYLELYLLSDMALDQEVWPIHNSFAAGIFVTAETTNIFDIYPDLYYKYSLFILSKDRKTIKARGNTREAIEFHLPWIAEKFIGELLQKRHPSALQRASMIIYRNADLLGEYRLDGDPSKETYLYIFCRNIYEEWNKLLSADPQAIAGFLYSMIAISACLPSLTETQRVILWNDIMALYCRALEFHVIPNTMYEESDSLFSAAFKCCTLPCVRQWLAPDHVRVSFFLKKLQAYALPWHQQSVEKDAEAPIGEYVLRMRVHYGQLCRIHTMVHQFNLQGWDSFIYQSLAHFLRGWFFTFLKIPQELQAEMHFNIIEMGADCLYRASRSTEFVNRYNELMTHFLNWIPHFSIKHGKQSAVIECLYKMCETLIGEGSPVQPMDDSGRKLRVRVFSSWMRSIFGAHEPVFNYFLNRYLQDPRVIALFKDFPREWELLKVFVRSIDEETRLSIDLYLSNFKLDG